MSLRTASFLAFLLSFSVLTGSAYGQAPSVTPTPAATPAPTPTPTATPAPTPIPPPTRNSDGSIAFTAEQIAESAIIIYGRGGGRIVLDQIRKTTQERGKVTITNAAGKTDIIPYQRWIVRGENSFKDKVRLEQDFPDARYSLVNNEEKIFGIFNDASFNPREDAVRSFENQMYRGLDGLLRYKENGSTLTQGEKTKILGVEYYVVDVTDKTGRKTRYFISTKSLKVMMLEYEENGITYKRRFYDYRYAQGTMIPYRTVLWADDKVVEETNIGTITYGQKIEDSLFPVT